MMIIDESPAAAAAGHGSDASFHPLPLKWGSDAVITGFHLAVSGYGGNPGAALMEYKRFAVQAFEREPGKWRARIRRVDGEPVQLTGTDKLDQSITRADERTQAAALLMAMAAIAEGTFVRDRAASEKFWRRREYESPRSAPPKLQRRRIKF